MEELSLIAINALVSLASSVAVPIFQERLGLNETRNQLSKIMFGLSYFLAGNYLMASEYFMEVDKHFPEWRVRYTMGIGLALACGDQLPAEQKISYSQRAVDLFESILSVQELSERERCEIQIRLGGIKKILLFTKRNNGQLPNGYENMDELLTVLKTGVEAAQRQDLSEWVEEGLYQLGCIYAMIEMGVQTQKCYDLLGHDSEMGIKLRNRILTHYNVNLNLHEDLRDN